MDSRRPAPASALGMADLSSACWTSGLRRTVVGHRMWGALKGAVDGGFKVAGEKGAESKYDAEAHKDRMFGNHVKEYMEMLQEEDPTKYEAHSSKFIAAGIDAEKMEEMYMEAHEKIC
ncbi:unnamed protein product [Polarella glacialis]|uniref:60S ribosomal protein L5 n=1 Tax=Polarella glacialis TaxID=89957 RepID=A0A813DEK3_POLGL|nr:unnamed protein product [Polarella glacialis]